MILVPHISPYYKGPAPDPGDPKKIIQVIIAICIQAVFFYGVYKFIQYLPTFSSKILEFKTVLIGVVIAGIFGAITGYKDRK